MHGRKKKRGFFLTTTTSPSHSVNRISSILYKTTKAQTTHAFHQSHHNSTNSMALHDPSTTTSLQDLSTQTLTQSQQLLITK